MTTTTVEQIEQAVLTLNDDDFRHLYEWIAEIDQQKWDRHIEEDSRTGVLDELANQALSEYQQGRATRL